MKRRFRQPAQPQWVGRARRLLEEAEPLSKQSTLRLLSRFVQAYDRHLETLAFIAGHVTTDEGDRRATEQAIGLPVSEVVEMAHDDMITRARLALRPSWLSCRATRKQKENV